MEDIKFILNANKNSIKYFIAFLLLFQTLYGFAANFGDNLNWFAAARNIFAFVSWVVVIYTPLWLINKLKSQRKYVPRYPFWLLGALFNGLLLGVFLLFGLVDFFIKLFILDIECTASTSRIFIISSLLGSVIILIVGGIVAAFAGNKKIK